MDNASEHEPASAFDELFSIHELEPRQAASPGAMGSGHVLHGSGGLGSGNIGRISAQAFGSGNTGRISAQASGGGSGT
ncbi:MAG TPA: hypothetical protein VII06_42390 [Chloroflexota bacterium]|jgi:hypothetical protein